MGWIGAAYIAARDDKPTPRPGTVADRTNRLSASPTLGHRLGVNGLFVDLAAFARSNPGASLDRWWSERRCRDITGDLAHPDGHGVWPEDGRTVAWWLEYSASQPRGVYAVSSGRRTIFDCLHKSSMINRRAASKLAGAPTLLASRHGP